MTKKSKKWLRFRVITLLLFFLVIFVVLISRAFQLQIITGKTLKGLAQKQHTKTLPLIPERGLILDRNGEKLAASILMDSVFADPAKIADSQKISAELSALLGEDRRVVLKKLTTSRHFCWISRQISPEQARSVQAANIEGVYLIKEPKRFYPNKELAGPLIGFVGRDAEGLEGVELKYDRYLKCQSDKMLWGRDAKGKRLYLKESLVSEKPDKGHNILLTIDSRIQYLVESQMKEAINRTGAKGGMAIVMDPRTGEILALVSEPGFNPNSFFKGRPEMMKNKAIADCFDPGSIFKPFVAAAALEEGVAKEEDKFYCENGAYQIANRTIHEAQRKKYGNLTFREIIKYSSNIGSVKISHRLGKEKFYQYIRGFGFGSKTGIDLPGEISGLLRPYQRWTNVDAATVAFGQGVSVTAIQLVAAMSSIANRGVLMKPYIVRGITDQNGQMIQEYKPTAVRRIISAATAERMISILTDVVGAEDGTGKRARIVNLAVAGKTGTSQKYDSGSRRYSSERVRTSFLGFLPADNARVAILVTLDEPKRDKWGGVAAAPVFKNIGEQILRCYDSRPGDGYIIEEKEVLPQDRGLRLVAADAPIPPLVQPAIAAVGDAAMPDFRGMTLKNVLKIAGEKRIEIKVLGSGWATTQDPMPGASIAESAVCTVRFSRGN
jgi:cell division protein FtsI (penicillin-binding protein 3)